MMRTRRRGDGVRRIIHSLFIHLQSSGKPSTWSPLAGLEEAMWSEDGELKSSEASRVSIHNNMYHSNSSSAATNTTRHRRLTSNI